MIKKISLIYIVFAALNLFASTDEKSRLDYAVKQIDTKPEKVFSYILAKESFDPQFDFSFVSALYECDVDFCPYSRCNSRWRALGKDYAVKLFRAYLERTEKKKHVLTFFACGSLYYEVQLLIKFAQELKRQKRMSDEVEVNLVDTTYDDTIQGCAAPGESFLGNINQFFKFAEHLLPGFKKLHVCSKVEGYENRIKKGECLPTDVLLAFDFGEISKLRIQCYLGLTYLKKFCTSAQFYVFCFPHPVSEAHIQIIENGTLNQEEEIKIKELYKELLAVDLDDPQGTWPKEKQQQYHKMTVASQPLVAAEYPFLRERRKSRKRQMLTVAGFFVFSSFLLR